MKKIRLFLYLSLFVSFFGIINSGYSQVAKTLLGTTTTNLTGTYTSVVKPTAGYTWFRGYIITDGGTGTTNQPVGYIEQSLNTASPLTWHGTDTITFSRSGNLWTGNINFAILGGYAHLVIGNFGNATLLAINWFVTPETTVNTTLNLTTTSTGSNTSVSVNTTSNKIIEANTSRRYLIIQNDGNADMFYSLTNPATTSSVRLTIGSILVYEAVASLYTGEIYAVTESGATTAKIQEHN